MALHPTIANEKQIYSDELYSRNSPELRDEMRMRQFQGYRAVEKLQVDGRRSALLYP